MPLIRTIANFDDIRRKEFRRFPVMRRCSRCSKEILIARIFGESKGRFIMHRCSEYGLMVNGRPAHLVRDRFARRAGHHQYWVAIGKLGRGNGVNKLWKEFDWRSTFIAERANLHLAEEEASV